MKPLKRLFSLGGIFGSSVLLSLAAGCATSTAGPGSSSPRASTAPSIGEVYEIHALSQTPVLRVRKFPTYPLAMRRNGIQGEVAVEFIVDSDGNVRTAHALSATNDDFADAAVQCVSTWKFSPGIKNGQPVNTVMQTPISFTLGPRS